MQVEVVRVTDDARAEWTFEVFPPFDESPAARLELVMYRRNEQADGEGAQTAFWSTLEEEQPLPGDHTDPRDVPCPSDVLKEARDRMMLQVRAAIAALVQPIVLPIDFFPEQAGK